MRILSDDDITKLLAGLSPTQLDGIFAALGDALHAYSHGSEKQFQCHRQAVVRTSSESNDSDDSAATTLLFMPATLSGAASVKVVGVPPPNSRKPLVGALLVCDGDGKAVGLINGAQLTAFRTSLGSIWFYRYRQQTSRIVVFGAGQQALWHLRLAMVLRRDDIASIAIVNRSRERADDLVAKLRAMDGSSSSKEIAYEVILSSDTEAVRSAVVAADAIFCTTPSTEPVFPGSYLTETKTETKTRFISAIGSYKLHMQEVDPGYLQTVALDNAFPGRYRVVEEDEENQTGSTILVDSRDACALEAGELVQAHLPEGHIVETGEVVELLKKSNEKDKERLTSWLRDGNVVYKSVGIGLMDLAVARALLDVAAEEGVGTEVAF